MKIIEKYVVTLLATIAFSALLAGADALGSMFTRSFPNDFLHYFTPIASIAVSLCAMIDLIDCAAYIVKQTRGYQKW